MLYLLVEVNGHIIADFANPIFLVHLFDLFLNIGERIIGDLEEF